MPDTWVMKCRFSINAGRLTASVLNLIVGISYVRPSRNDCHYNRDPLGRKRFKEACKDATHVFSADVKKLRSLQIKVRILDPGDMLVLSVLHCGVCALHREVVSVGGALFF